MTNQAIMAEQLNGQHIGRFVRFAWKWPYTLVQAIVTGELREVKHNGTDDVIVLLTGLECDSGDKTEFTIPAGTTVAFS